MAEVTLEALVKRIEALEQRLARVEVPKQDLRSVYGMFEGNEFMKQMDEEILATREAERQAAREGRFE